MGAGVSRITQNAASTRPAPAPVTSSPMRGPPRWACCPSSPPARRTGPRDVPQNGRLRDSMAHPPSETRRRSGQRTLAEDVFPPRLQPSPCAGYTTLVRQTSRHGGPSGHQLHSQGPERQDGGWRYNPGDPGDTSVTGWQLNGLEKREAGRIERGRTDAQRRRRMARLRWPRPWQPICLSTGLADRPDTMTAVGCSAVSSWARSGTTRGSSKA